MDKSANNINRKKGYRHSTTFYRKLKSELKTIPVKTHIINEAKLNISTFSIDKQFNHVILHPADHQNYIPPVFLDDEDICNSQNILEQDKCYVPDSEDSDFEKLTHDEFVLDFLQQFIEWCLKHRITHSPISYII